ncbi:MAG: hypothetical protein M3358_13960 [Actinomycetota bacterium]|nr:hypothetical protein [Actinomycetota bacterium]
MSRLERGQRRRPYPHTVRALAEALDLSTGPCSRPFKPSCARRGSSWC